MIRKLAHIAIVVRSLEEALPFYTEKLGLGPARIHDVPAQGVRVAYLPAGGAEIELVEPVDPQSGVARFLEKRGEGLHHISFDVEDLPAALDGLAGQGVELIDRRPRPGTNGPVAFVHPRAARGVLIELEAGENTDERTE